MDEIISAFSTLAYDSVTMPDFDKEWQEMIQQFQLDQSEWLSKLYVKARLSHVITQCFD
jgi:hypothetical protein